MCTPQEIQAVRDALARNVNNIGVGIVHEPTGRIYLKPFDDVPGGHAQLAMDHGLPLNETRGFIVGLVAGQYQVVNISHLNNPAGLGASGSLQMEQSLFDQVLQSLRNAGLIP